MFDPHDECGSGCSATIRELRLYGADAAVPLPWFTIKGGGGVLHFLDVRIRMNTRCT